MFSRIFCLIFLIDAIKPKVEKKFQIFLRDCFGEVSRERTNKTSFGYFRVRFVGSNKNIIQTERKTSLKISKTKRH
jgi:hypothetical protein